MEKLELSYIVGWTVKYCRHLKQFDSLPYKILPLSIQPRDTKTYVHTEMCTRVLIAVSFATAKN